MISASVRQGIAAILPDLRGFARFLTRDVGEADDLVQETIVRALGAQAQFNPGTSLKAWLFTIERHAFYEARRRQARERTIMADIEAETPDSMSSGGAPLRDSVLDLSALLWQLPELLREALILIGAQELSYEEAAQICAVPVGTMKARVSRARTKLVEMAGDSVAGLNFS